MNAARLVGVLLMVAIGSTALIPLRYSDRAAYAQSVANNSRGLVTAEEVAKRNDEADIRALQSMESTAAWARGEGVIIGLSKGNASVSLNMRAQPDPLVYTRQLNKYPDGRSVELNAFDVNFVIENQEKIYGHDLKNIAYYAEYLQNSMSHGLQQDPEYEFNGSWGSDRITHDVNEYIGWLYDRAAIDRPASFTEVKDAFMPDIEGVIDFDPAVLAEAHRKLDAAYAAGHKISFAPLSSDGGQPEEIKAAAQAAPVPPTAPTIDEMKQHIIAALKSGGSADMKPGSATQILELLYDDQKSAGIETERRQWA